MRRPFQVSWYYLYITLSNLIVLLLTVDAVLTFEQFFPTVVFLTSSRAYNVLLSNAMIANVFLAGSVLRRIFFGKLNPVERQRLNEEFFVQMFESLFGLMYFQQSMSTLLTIAFALTNGVKMFHFLGVARLGTIERAPQRNAKDIRRLSLFLFVCLFVDACFMMQLTTQVIEQGISVHVLLLLNFAVMTLSSVVTMGKLLVFLADEGGRAPYRFYIEVISTITESILYIVFFAAMCNVAFPIHLIRELLRSCKNVFTTLRSLLKYRKLAANIDRSFQLATTEDLDRDRRCAVCYDDMLDDTSCKRLGCGHCYHRDCLRKWLETSSSCPYCRKEIEVQSPRAPHRPVVHHDAAPPVVAPQAPAPLAPAVAAMAPPQYVPPQNAAAAAVVNGSDASKVSAASTTPDAVQDAEVEAAYAIYLRIQSSTPSRSQANMESIINIAQLTAQVHAYQRYKESVDSAMRKLEGELLAIRLTSAAFAPADTPQDTPQESFASS